jgi:hypothetical protein
MLKKFFILKCGGFHHSQLLRRLGAQHQQLRNHLDCSHKHHVHYCTVQRRQLLTGHEDCQQVLLEWGVLVVLQDGGIQQLTKAK